MIFNPYHFIGSCQVSDIAEDLSDGEVGSESICVCLLFFNLFRGVPFYFFSFLQAEGEAAIEADYNGIVGTCLQEHASMKRYMDPIDLQDAQRRFTLHVLVGSSGVCPLFPIRVVERGLAL